LRDVSGVVLGELARQPRGASRSAPQSGRDAPTMEHREEKLKLVYRKYVLGHDGIDASVTHEILEELLSEAMGEYSFYRFLRSEASDEFLSSWMLKR
jgi:hypothetical protein